MTDMPHGPRIPRGDFRQRRRICAGKDAAADPGVQRARDVAADEMKQPTAGVTFQCSAQDIGEAVVVLKPHVFEHPHRYEGVEFTNDIAIVVVDEFDLPAESFTRRAIARVGQLLA